MSIQDVNGGPGPGATFPPAKHPDPVRMAAAIVEAAEIRSILDAVVVNHRIELADSADELALIADSATAFEDLAPEKAGLFLAVAVSMLAAAAPAGDRS